MQLHCNTITLPALLALALASAGDVRAADSAERAQATKERIQVLRTECVKVRRQIGATMEELKRLNTKGVDLRTQFEKYKAELAKMEEMAKVARDRADAMKSKGQTAFAEWEQEVQAINNPDIRKVAEKRLHKRQKSYTAILHAMGEARQELVPFMSNLNDVRKLLDSELTEGTVASTKSLIRQTDWHGEDVRNSLSDVEKELDRMSAELAKYK